MGLISKFRNSERETSEAPNPFELPINEAEVRRAEALPESEAMAEAEKAADGYKHSFPTRRSSDLGASHR